MLSVARAAAAAAIELAADPGARARDVLTAGAAAAREALARTPELLPVLRAAGVVDAGGRGISVVLDAAETALTGRRPTPVTSPLGHHQIPVPLAPGDTQSVASDDGGPAYEVMYLLEADDEKVSALRTRLGDLGDSLVVVGGDGLWNVHVHVDDAGAAIEAGIEAGRPHRVRVSHFATERGPGRAGPTTPSGRRVITVAAGPGLAELFEEAGAVVVRSTGRRPSTGEVLEAITSSGAREVVVLPNDGDSMRVAQIAASTAQTDHGLRSRRHPDPGADPGPGGGRGARARTHLRPRRHRDDRHRPPTPGTAL